MGELGHWYLPRRWHARTPVSRRLCVMGKQGHRYNMEMGYVKQGQARTLY